MAIAALFSFQFIIMVLINIPWITYYDEHEVQDLKDDMVDFSNSHQNPDSGLFIEPTIDSNYRAIDSINFSSSILLSTNLINPRYNDHLDKDMEDLFFYYLFEKQNNNGSFSDINGFGNMFSTFEVIETIDKLDGTFINLHYKEDEVNKISLIIQYLKNSLVKNGYGFMINEYSPVADIISTYCAIKLAKRFSATYILNNENITKFVNATLYDDTPESTYYRIQSYLELGLNFSLAQKIIMTGYFLTLYNGLDGGYSTAPGGESDIQSTYYALASLYSLNITPVNEKKSLYYALNCSKPDGGFGYRPDNVDDDYSSEFISGWAAMNSITYLEQNVSLSGISTISYKNNYYNWLYKHQAENGLFGDVSIQANYWGVLSNYLVDKENLGEDVEIKEIWEFVEDCYDKKDGGFGYKLGEDSSLFSTYCAINLYEMFYGYEELEFPDSNKTINYLVDLQNLNGGFELGLDVDQFNTFFGPLGEIFFSLLKTNMSTVESTYWALYSLNALNALEKIDEEDLMHWISSCQNADGGFSVILGFHSDTISTYFGLQIFFLLDSEPMSQISVIEFLKNAQNDEGSFDPMPALSLIFNIPTSFLITFFASMGLYDYDYQPDDVEELINWYEDCFSSNTGGMGDYPRFGGDLRNTPYGIILIDELRYDHDFNPNPWTELIIIIFLSEILIIFLFGIIKVISILNTKISKELKTRYGIGEKLNISYLKKFPAIYCENLNVYAGRKLIVDSVSMIIEHGEILGVLGESGAGKSTFVKALLGMRKFSGINQVYGMDIKKNAKKIRSIYGYVPQDLSKIYQNFTTLQNIMYFGKQYNLSEKEITNRAKRILRSLEIEDKMHEKVKNLSGGQKRRVSIAIALIHNPVIIWMDEPTSGLDAIVRTRILEVILKLKDQFGTTFAIISHYPEESNYYDKIAIFGRKKGMIAFGEKNDLIKEMSGNGRTIHLTFNNYQYDVIIKTEKIEGIEKVFEKISGIQYLIFSDLTLDIIKDRIEPHFGFGSIKEIVQKDSTMEEYFRYKAIEVPKIE